METKQGQSFLDLVIQGTGDVYNAFEMALKNNRNLTDDLKIGEEIQASQITNNRVVNLFSLSHKPATAFNKNDLPPVLEGISYWAINQDFIVQ